MPGVAQTAAKAWAVIFSPAPFSRKTESAALMGPLADIGARVDPEGKNHGPAKTMAASNPVQTCWFFPTPGPVHRRPGSVDGEAATLVSTGSEIGGIMDIAEGFST